VIERLGAVVEFALFVLAFFLLLSRKGSFSFFSLSVLILRPFLEDPSVSREVE